MIKPIVAWLLEVPRTDPIVALWRSLVFVTRFAVHADFLAQYEARTVGASRHQEYWIPADHLAELNRNIVGVIEVIAEFHGKAPRSA